MLRRVVGIDLFILLSYSILSGAAAGATVCRVLLYVAVYCVPVKSQGDAFNTIYLPSNSEFLSLAKR